MMLLTLICFKKYLLMEEKYLMVQKSTCSSWVYLCEYGSVEKAVKFQCKHFRLTYLNRLLLYNCSRDVPDMVVAVEKVFIWKSFA